MYKSYFAVLFPMNRFVFGIKNIYDKLLKTRKDPRILGFYIHTYVLSRSRQVEPDIYIVSYPKCGITWIRITLQKYLELYGHKETSEKDRNLVKLPDTNILKFTHDLGSWVPAPPRIDQLYFDDSKYREKKICFVVRNPCDVLVSSWYHLKYRERIYSGGLSEFIRDDTLGIHKVVAFMNMWVENMDISSKFYLVTYEEMRKAPEAGFHALFDFIGLDVDPSVLKSAIEETSFEKMKQMEIKGALSEPWMKIGTEKSEKSMKIRKGKVGGYKDELLPEDIKFLDDVITRSLSQRLPYGRKKE